MSILGPAILILIFAALWRIGDKIIDAEATAIRLSHYAREDADRRSEFEQAASTLRGRRWNTREADALAELVEIGRELP